MIRLPGAKLIGEKCGRRRGKKESAENQGEAK